jgi:hypothetical protein
MFLLRLFGYVRFYFRISVLLQFTGCHFDELHFLLRTYLCEKLLEQHQENFQPAYVSRELSLISWELHEKYLS